MSEQIERLKVLLSSTLDPQKRAQIKAEIDRREALERPTTGEKPQVGDLALHKNGRLDARTVVQVEPRGVWLDLGSKEPWGPFPSSNYTYRRPVIEAGRTEGSPGFAGGQFEDRVYDPLFIPRAADLPYNGKSKVGHSEAGQAQQEKDDADGGATGHRQITTLAALAGREKSGITIAELCDTYGWHHGQASSALSVLNKVGHIVRLKTRRKGQSVYVLPEFVDGREVAVRRVNPNVVVVGEPEVNHVEVPVPTPVELPPAEVAFVQDVRRRVSLVGRGTPTISMKTPTVERLLDIIDTLQGGAAPAPKAGS